MRRPYILLLLLLLGTTALVQAQSVTMPDSGTVEVPPSPMIGGDWKPYILERIDSSQVPLEFLSNVGGDECTEAPTLSLPGGDISTVNFMTENPADPDLEACMYGTPPSPLGFRSVWYRFIPQRSGIVNITTTFDPANYPDSYDTVVALHRAGDPNNACSTLALVACNDDANGFLSEVEAFVQQGQVYYIEVVDWQFKVTAEATLRLAVTLDPADSLWHVQGDASAGWMPAVSRHAVVAYNAGPDSNYLYVIAGQMTVDATPQRTGTVNRYHVQSGTWEEMMPMPGFGYSNSTAALVGSKIYMPAGYVGNNSQYDGLHRVYDIGLDQWLISPSPAPWDLLDGQAYAWSVAVPLTIGQTPGYFLTGGVLPSPGNPTDTPVGRILFFAPGPDGLSGTWTITLQPMSVPRYAHVAGAVPRDTPAGNETQICVAGGITETPEGTQISTNHAECYSNISGAWETIAPLNFNRYMADSAVDPDGHWYVYGGTTVGLDEDGDEVLILQPATERYDPETNTWQVLDARYDLDDPERNWPRGTFVGDTLWTFGGETFNTQFGTWDVVPLVETLFLPPQAQFQPTVVTGREGNSEPNDTLETATPIAFFAPQLHDFPVIEDYFDVFVFNVTSPTAVAARVTEIPFPSDYDVYVYDSNKFQVGSSTNIGSQDESAETFVLTPGVYYAMVVRVVPITSQSHYRIEIVPIP